MTTLMPLLVALGVGLQEDPAKEIPRLIQKLRSDQIEERERGMEELRRIGKAAIPELEKLSRDTDLDLASRARSVVRSIRFKELFGVDTSDATGIPASRIVDWMQQKTGRRFVFSAELGLQNQKVRVPVDLVDVSDSYATGLELLRVANLGAAPSAAWPGAVEIFPASLAAKRTLKVCKEAQELPQANECCVLVLHPRHVSPRDLQAALINMVTYPQNCLSEEQSGSVLLTDYASMLRKCVEIANALDASRGFRVSVAILEGSSGKEPSIPEAFRNLKLEEATGGLNQFHILGQAAARLERLIIGRQDARKTSLGFPANTPLLVEFEGGVRAAGGPKLEHFVVRRDAERPEDQKRLLETNFELRDENWLLVGMAPAGREGVTLVILVRATVD